MDQYGTPYYVQSSQNYSRQQTPFTNQYVYDDLSDNLRVSSPFSQDFSQPNIVQNTSILRKQLNQQMKRNNVLLQEVNTLQMQNQQLRRTRVSNSNLSSLKSENDRLREEIARRKQQSNVPQHLIEQLGELRRQNGWLRQNVQNLNQKHYQRY